MILLVDCEDPDQTADVQGDQGLQAVCICPKTLSMALPITYSLLPVEVSYSGWVVAIWHNILQRQTYLSK